jgi:hypothetical protein
MPRFELNERAEFLNCSDRCSRLFGIPSHRIAGRRFDEFVSRESGPRLLQALLDAYRGRQVSGVPLTVTNASDCRTHVIASFMAEINPHTRQIDRLLGEFECADRKLRVTR